MLCEGQGTTTVEITLINQMLEGARGLKESQAGKQEPDIIMSDKAAELQKREVKSVRTPGWKPLFLRTKV